MKDECHDCAAELAAFANGELDSVSREQVRRHLDRCRDCQSELASEIGLRDELGGLPVFECPASVTNTVLAGVARTVSASRRRARYRVAGLGVAAASLAIVLGLRLWPMASPGAGSLPQDYTDEQIAAARNDMINSLALTARILDRTGRGTLSRVFADQLPAVVTGALRSIDQPTGIDHPTEGG